MVPPLVPEPPSHTLSGYGPPCPPPLPLPPLRLCR